MKLFKPMKGCEIPNPEHMVFPLMMSPKIDGIRATKQEHLYAASLKLIPNKYLQQKYRKIPNGLDGELKLGDPWEDNFRDTTSAIMRHEGQPDDIKFYVFDLFGPDRAIERYLKLTELMDQINTPDVILVKQELILNLEQMYAQHDTHLNMGYEGSMLRAIKSPYKQGKSTPNEGYLYKWKDFSDSEAIILDYVPLYKNNNETIINELGYKSRSTSKDNKEALDMLGAIYVEDLYTKRTFLIGTGFDKQERIDLWQHRDKLKHKIVKYRYLKTGGYDKPRNLSFKGFRDPRDLTEY